MRVPEAQLYATRESAEGAIVCDTPQPARQGRYILLIYYIKTKSRLSIRPTIQPISQLCLHGSMWDLLEMKAASFGIM